MKKLGIQTVIFTIGNEEYGFPIETVKEIANLSEIYPLPKAPGYIKGLINIRGETLPLIDLHNKFGIDSGSKNELAIIVEINENLVGMAVDEVREVKTFEKVDPPPALVTVPFIKGIINLGDRMIIQIAPECLFDDAEIEELAKITD